METHKIWIVIPVFNRKKEIYSLLKQLFLQTFENYTIVVVDHGTTAIDFSLFNDNRLKIVRASSTIWWTGAINAGIIEIYDKAFASDFILLINDDVVIDTDYIHNLYQASEKYPNSIIGSTGVDKDTHRVMYSGHLLDKQKARFYSPHEGQKYGGNKKKGEVCESHILCGRGMLIPFKIMITVGSFNEERLPHYGADYEFSWQSHKLGYRVICALDAVVYTSHKKDEYSAEDNSSLMNHLTDIRLAGNISAMSNFAILSFSKTYAAYYILLNTLRRILFYLRIHWLNLRQTK
jgi:GT2 family glycosyltransferase